MKFEIKGDDTEKIKKFLDEFIAESKAEFQKQIKKVPFHSRIPGLPDQLDLGYYEKDGAIILVNPMPMMKFFMHGKARKRMIGNVKGFLEANGLKVEVKFLGD
jgi:hypothetical protein